MAPAPSHVRVETLDGYRILRHPYRAMLTGRPTLRLIVSIAARRMSPCEVRIEVDDALVEVSGPRGAFTLTAIDQLFVVERQPPAWRFLPWYGVFARRHGHSDQLLVETPDDRVARYVERAVEQRLGLRDEPVRGELRVAE